VLLDFCAHLTRIGGVHGAAAAQAVQSKETKEERKQAKVEAHDEGDRAAKENPARGRGISHGGPGELGRKLARAIGLTHGG
jgi:hypothetical protein